METDNGGWTLFLNYKHENSQNQPYRPNLTSEAQNGSKLPEDLNDNSHMYLTNAGFIPRDVREVRFLCTENDRGNKKYWHFKSSSSALIDIAMTGLQTTGRVNKTYF